MNGADKPMLMLAGRTLMEHVIEKSAPQVDELLINANRDIARFARFGLEVIPDVIGGSAGPLAGILAGQRWARENHAGARWLVSFACDCPFIPADLAARLIAGAEQAGVPLATAASGGRRHPVFSAWSMELPLDPDDLLITRGFRKVDRLISEFPHCAIEFPAIPFDPFFNINDPEDLLRAEEFAGSERQLHA